MNRLYLIPAVALLLSLGMLTTPVAAEEMSCFDHCKACQKLCLQCADSCLSEMAEGQEGRLKCIKLCLDCADICEACAKVSARDGALEPVIAAACAKACETCAAECSKHTGDEVCQACAKQCKMCAKHCRMVASKG